MKDHHVLFEEYLSRHAGRYTSQKKIIVEHVFEAKEHFEIEDFINNLRAEKYRFSRSTVYRTVRQLLEASLIQKISTHDGKVLYEPKRGRRHHDHLICNSCGKILEIKQPVIDEFLDKHCEKIGFTPEYRSLHIYGYCKQCAKKQVLKRH